MAARTDHRDAPIREALDRAITDVDPDVGASLPRVLERGRRLRARRVAATALVAAVLVSGLGWLSFQSRPHRLLASLDVTTWVVAGGPERGWHLRHPVGWNVQDLGEERCRSPEVSGGILVTNVDATLHHPDGRTTGCWERWVLADFPEAGVGVQVQPAPPPQFPPDLRQLPDTTFPLSADDFRFTGRVLGGPSTRSLQVVRGGRATLAVTLFVGPRARGHDLEVARSLVGTIRLARPGIRWRTADLGAGSVAVRSPSGRGWTTRAIVGTCPAHPYRGLLVANVEVRQAGDDPCARAAPAVRRLASRGVVVAVAVRTGGPLVDLDDQLTVDPAVWTAEAPPVADGALQPVVMDGFRMVGRTVVVTVWFGADATLGSRLVARHVVGSIRTGGPGGSSPA